MISYTDLVSDKEYYLKTYDTGEYFKGMKFHDYQTSLQAMTIGHYAKLNMIFRRTTYFYLFYEEDYYYDPEKIKENAKKARQQMESRALKQVLKGIINETFEWYAY